MGSLIDDVGMNTGIILKITSGGQTDIITFNLEVTNTNDAPTITETPLATIAEDSPYTFMPGGGDVDAGDTPEYTLEGNSPAWLLVDSSTGELSGTPENDDVGMSTGIILRITSGGQSAITTFDLEVINISDAPTITGTPAATIAEGTPYTFMPGGGDADAGATLVYTLENSPAWLLVNTATGELSGTPENDDVGPNTGIILKITSGGQEATLSFDLEVTNTNDAPTAVGNISPLNLTVATGDDTRDVSNNFTDPDGDTLTFSITSLSGNGVATAVIHDMTGIVTVTALDGSVVSITQNLMVTVSATPNPVPTAVSTITVLTLTAGGATDTRDVAGNFSDSDTDALTYTAIFDDGLSPWLLLLVTAS